MNQLRGIITAIESSDSISLITVEALGQSFSSLVIDTPETAPYLAVGKAVVMVFKETEVSVGKNLSGGLSLRNRFASTIQAIHRGQVLTQLTLNCQGHEINAIITTKSVQEMNLRIGDQVEGLVKTNEITLSDC